MIIIYDRHITKVAQPGAAHLPRWTHGGTPGTNFGRSWELGTPDRQDPYSREPFGEYYIIRIYRDDRDTCFHRDLFIGIYRD